MINITKFLENKDVWIGVFVAIVAYFLLRSSNRRDKNFEKEYNDILNSDKYRAKGQYE